MKLKNKKLLVTASTLIALTLPTISYAQSETMNVQYVTQSSTQIENTIELNSTEIVPFADIIGWRYKDVDGQMYRRQYNY